MTFFNQLPVRRCILATLFAFPVWAIAATGSATQTTDRTQLREWVVEMKNEQRGPFARIRWFCNDGTVLPPKPYACQSHGDGHQHGERNEKANAIRSQGYAIANVLAELSPPEVLQSKDDLLQQILLEQFLITVDDGWILHEARYYRGAFQAEDEEASAKQILYALLADDEQLSKHLLLAYETARLLPHGVAQGDLTKLRADAASLQELDQGFGPLRNKIHGKPEPSDAAAIRSYAKRQGRPELSSQYEALAVAIEQITSPGRVQQRLEDLAGSARNRTLKKQLTQIIQSLAKTQEPTARLTIASDASAELRRMLPTIKEAADRLVAVDAALVLGQSLFVDAQALGAQLPAASRRQRLDWLAQLAQAWYGLGGMSDYEWQQFQRSATQLSAAQIGLVEYRAGLAALRRVPTWAQRRLALNFEESIAHLAELEPLTKEFIPDRLRSSPMLMYSLILQSLVGDANTLAGVRHDLFGDTISTGLRSLNPGLATGILVTPADNEKNPRPGVSKIMVVPETLADLPPVSGILTENEGNHLSHVQLLARNLGIPNVVVGREVLGQIDAHLGQPIKLAASPAGIVQIRAVPAAEFAASTTESKPQANTQIVVDLNKLDLSPRNAIPLDQLRSTDSGVRVGPKAAKLGELNARYPGTVSAALALPFGAFRALLDQPFDQSGDSAFVWLTRQYQELAKITDSTSQLARRNQILATIRQWILTEKLNPDFVAGLRQQMNEAFGPDGSYGVFVRSDTNVEDLPGFTGAGLNLTVPNAVGFDQVFEAIRQVWASPFTERSFGWRQALMDRPEHLYAAVLLHKSVNSDRSGVMVTADVETGSTDSLTVVMNEGVGGGVEGQSAETTLIDRQSGQTTLITSATTPRKRVVLKQGGSKLVPAGGLERLLSPSDVQRLQVLAKDIATWLVSDDGKSLIADVEFGFLNNQLVLFQIRPYVENRTASQNTELLALDAPLRALTDINVNLLQTPKAQP